MDRFQATSSGDIIDARLRSAVFFADPLLCHALKALLSSGGPAALNEFRAAAQTLIAGSLSDHPSAEIMREFAIEEVERAIIVAQGGETSLKGWHPEGLESIEERKPR